MNENKKTRTFGKPRGTLPSWTTPHGLVYLDTEFPFRYVFETPTRGYVEVQSEDGTWTRAASLVKYRRRDLTYTLLEARKNAAGSIAGSIEKAIVACAIAATGGNAVRHFRSYWPTTHCGLSYHHTGVYIADAIVETTCRECRARLVNAVMAMPFLDEE